MSRIYQLETPRLLLRQWQETDKAPLAQLNADERVMAHFPATLSRDQSDAMVARLQGEIEQRGWGLWALETKREHDFIGCVGLNSPAAALPLAHPCVEVGWRLAFAYWGYGYATEAAQASLTFGFETLELEKIVSFTALSNRRSQAVMKRLGMTLMPETFMHPSVPVESGLKEHCLYELTREQYSQKQNARIHHTQELYNQEQYNRE
ncbi:MAG: GNAT family N-acetyltransferase [Phormidesmis sp. RL_2_1]|nr:GNAT family N-acetyltransferase [Phormidesmis sp. RL_2_1]